MSIALAVDEQKSPEEIIAELRAENVSLRNQRDLAQARLEALLHRLYGKSTERYVDEGFGPLFEGQELPEPPPPPHVDEAPDDEEVPDPAIRGSPSLLSWMSAGFVLWAHLGTLSTRTTLQVASEVRQGV